MSLGRLVPVALAVGFGVLNGYVTFNPAFQDLEADKIKKEAMAEADLGPNLIEIPIKKSGATDNSSGSEAQNGQGVGQNGAKT